MDSVVSNSYATGSVIENGIWFLPMVGSFTGRLEGDIVNCYATGNTTVIDRTGDSHPYNTIVGSRRGEGGSIIQCADFTSNSSESLFVVDEPYGEVPATTDVSVSHAYLESTYTAIGWDFNEVWMIPEIDYSLPILSGVNEPLQKMQKLPEHFTRT